MHTRVIRVSHRPMTMTMTGEPQNKQAGPGIAQYAQLGLVFPAATLIGWLFGVALDHWLHTTWLYVVGLILGIVAGFVELIRTVMKNSRTS